MRYLKNVSKQYKLPRLNDEAYRKMFYGLSDVLSKEHQQIIRTALEYRYVQHRGTPAQLETWAVLDGKKAEAAAAAAASETETETTNDEATLADIVTRLDRIIELLTPGPASDEDPIEEITEAVEEAIEAAAAEEEAVTDEDLIEGIETQKIGGLGLDTVEGETGIVHLDRRTDIISNKNIAYLRQFPNVVMTQHMAFYTDAAVTGMVRSSLEGLKSMAETGKFRTML